MTASKTWDYCEAMCSPVKGGLAAASSGEEPLTVCAPRLFLLPISSKPNSAVSCAIMKVMTTNAATPSRRRLFQRQEMERRELTPREHKLLEHVARHRLIASGDLALLDGGSPQNVLRLLRELFDMGLVERPAFQVNNWAVAGPRPMIYGMTNKGVRLLHGRREEVDHSERNRRAGSVFVHHTAEIAAFFARLEVGCRNREDVNLLMQADILAEAPEPTRLLREPTRIKGQEDGSSARLPSTLIPDGMFALEFADDTAAHFFLELDRGTMPVVRKGMDRTSFARKLQVYLDAWRAGVFEAQFGVRHVRVLTVTPSPERVKTMIAAVKALTKGNGSGLFLFIDRGTLIKHGPLDVEWTDGTGKATKLTAE